MLLRHQSDKVRLLETVPLFSGLSKRQLELIAGEGHERRVLHGRVIARQGRLGSEFFVIVEGRARVERDGRLIARLTKDCFGEMSLIDGGPRSASVTAESDIVVLLVVSGSKFRGLIQDVPGLSLKLLTTLCRRLRSADIQLASRN
ncbi:MAG: cyclic nucleotide-binding domain-containing protein [Chloroflexi bacterium]|nr:cyclic nucleotide-binding domain-containing protein [Chloroflexota bacterium]